MSKKVVYTKKTLREHILHKPTTYLGADSTDKQLMTIYSEKDDGRKIIDKTINFTPALYKLFDEIISNASDNSKTDKNCDTIKVSIIRPNKENGLSATQIVVWNNATGIAVEIHEKEGIYNIQLVFCELLTSSNYDEEIEREVIGTNGYGGKLVNIFSTEFIVENVDSVNKKKYIQKSEANMTIINEPKITSCKSKGYVQISFIPDYARLKMEDLSTDMEALFKRRTYDIAATSTKKIKVYFNGELITANSFTKYVDLFCPIENKPKKIVDDENDRWKVIAYYTPGTEFRAFSFVNGGFTPEGGRHVDYVMRQLVKGLTEIISKKHKTLTVKPEQVKEGLTIFINATIIKPSFNSQSKTKLETPVDKFGSKYTLPEKFIKNLAKTGILDNIIKTAQFKELSLVDKTSAGKKTKRIFVDKLDDAQDAGGKNGHECSLILTEGDSAKAFALSALKVIGNKRYGVFPLKGKLLNVRSATVQQLLKNEEINNIIKIIGLQHKKEYTDTKPLRYGRILILADQDYDGSHIKGLIINFIHHFFPTLLKNVDSFVVSVPTPILKAKLGTGKKQQVETFYTIQDFETWKEKMGKEADKWEIKYYKGLGTSTAVEARECFMDLEKKLVHYKWTDDEYEEFAKLKKVSKAKPVKVKKEDSEDEYDDEETETPEPNGLGYIPVCANKNEDSITLCFDKERIPNRKGWLMNYDSREILDNSKTVVPYHQFFHREMKHFSNDDCSRSIPSMVDGFKPSLRKILFATFLKNLKKEIKVAQLAGYVSEKSGYHHGEASLIGAIIGMAQNFVGSNNINLLTPNGQFGTRLMGGKDAASARYIFTNLDNITRLLFRKEDEAVLTYLDDDGLTVEPEWYCPILPMILVNGALGIGTGFSTKVQPHNPRDIVANIRRLMKGEPLKKMQPWYRYFKGTVEKVAENSYLTKGCYTVDEKKETVHITELPVGVWTDVYKAFLEEVIQAGETQKKGKGKAKTEEKPKRVKVDSFLEDFKANNNDMDVSFTLQFKDGRLKEMIKAGTLEKKLKLVKSVSTANMHLYNEKGVITKYRSVEDIIRAHYNVRIVMYTERKEFILKKLALVLELLKWKRKFIKNVIAVPPVIVINKKKKDEIIERLVELGFPKLNAKKASVNYVKEDDDTTEDDGASGKSYNYITSLPLFSLTEEKINQLEEEYNRTKQEIADLESQTEVDMWNKDLDEFMEAYEKWEVSEVEKLQDNTNLSKKKK